MSGLAPHVVVYSSPLCGFCASAKRLLKSKQVEFEEINVLLDSQKRKEMQERSSRTTVPQIFIGETHVGGCDDLYALEASGELDSLLGLQGD